MPNGLGYEFVASVRRFFVSLKLGNNGQAISYVNIAVVSKRFFYSYALFHEDHKLLHKKLDVRIARAFSDFLFSTKVQDVYYYGTSLRMEVLQQRPKITPQECKETQKDQLIGSSTFLVPDQKVNPSVRIQIRWIFILI